MDVEPCRLDELSSIHTDFGTCSPASYPEIDVLVISFRGQADNCREHFGAFAMMRAMIAAGIAAWKPHGVVLDLLHLTYSWGDNMAEVLWFGGDLPLAVVISDLNREGLTSLVRSEMGQEPETWLFSSLEDAMISIGRKLANQWDCKF